MNPQIIAKRSRLDVRLLIPLIVLLLLLVGYGSYQFGIEQGNSDFAHQLEEIAQLKDAVKEGDDRLSELRQQEVITRRSSLVDREAQRALAKSISQMRQQQVELEKELAFYRKIINPSNGKSGLTIDSVAFEQSTSEQGLYHYRLVLTQVKNNSKVVSGSVKMLIVGNKSDGTVGRIKSQSLSPEGEKPSLAFKFRYFQVLVGAIVLPSGFTPKKVDLEVKPKGRRYKDVKREVAWPQLLQSEG